MPQVPKYELPPLDLGDETIGERIARIRKQQGLTQVQLGEIIGISQKLITHYERGKLHLNDEMIIRFALALGVNSDVILGLKDSKLLKDKTLPLRYTRRMRELDKLPEKKIKTILQMLDDLIKANS